MAHVHNVVDSDAHFIIDPATRAIKKEESAKTSLIVGDHNSERFSFELPRYIEGHDMSLCNVVRVHYMNTSSTRTDLQSTGVYEVDDFGVMSTDDTKMGLSWLISNNATKHVGKLAFTVQFACMTGYRVEYSWQSGVYSSISISDGINGSEIVFDEYADILQQWWLKIYASSELPIKTYTAKEFEALNGKTESGVLYLLEDDPTPIIIEEHGKAIVKHESQISDHETRIGNAESQISDHGTRIGNAESQISDHETRIGNAESQISDHGTRIGNAETQISNHGTMMEITESQISDHETRIGNAESQISDHETRIGNTESQLDVQSKLINQNTFDIGNLENNTKNFHTYNEYTLIVDTEDNVHNSVVDGLWLFKVNCGANKHNANGSVSVIMDTSCQYSTMFYISFPNGNSVDHYLAAIKRVSRDPDYFTVKFRVVLFKPNVVEVNGYTIPTYTFVEEYASNDVIWGKPFGFSNPLG